MKLHFDPNQQFQHDAINSIVGIFEGQPLNQGDFSFSISSENYMFQEGGVGNRLEISKEQIFKNVQEIQKKNELTISDKLYGMNFSIEMETGTGKTYVYLRTIYELNKKYGFKKFVIVVPSIAIREGVLKNLEITFDHFQNLYDKTPVNFDVYDSKRVSNLRNFAINNNVQILVINIDSFAKDENIINKPNDKLTGKRPIEFIQATSPIVIVDEPQNMETEIRKKAVENLNPLCTLRYSATHTNRYNMVYSLDPVKAYDLGLVKQIEVDSIITENDFNEAYLCLEKVTATKTRTSAKIKIDVNTSDGAKRKSVAAKVGDDLYDLSNKREIYKNGYIINGIDIAENLIELSNGETIFVGDTFGGLSDEIMKVQIRKTVEEHFLKERKLKTKGIKVLSLFFIDRVANYRGYDSDGNSVKGKFAKWFEEIFKETTSKSAYKGLIPFDAEEVHNGYFSADKKGHWKDTRGNTQADNDTFKLIMKNKEQLLNTDEPLRFIFSHSALREGWDNPNVFQICTLKKGFELDEKFKSIWDRIKYQTTYRVEYNTSELIMKAAKAVRQMPAIRKAVIKTTKTAIEFDDSGIVMDIKASYATSLDSMFRIPDVLFYIQERTELTRSTIFEILKKSGRISEVLINPQLFLDNAIIALKDILTEFMIEGIKYEKIGFKEYEMRLFEDYEIHINDLTFKINKKDKTIYSNLVPLDSNVEYEFARECESRDDIEFYFKLPFWFKIKTPIGNYNPDWALIKKNEKTIYFVAETKSAGQELKLSEKRKIKCGRAHFNEFEDVKYRQVAKVGELD